MNTRTRLILTLMFACGAPAIVVAQPAADEPSLRVAVIIDGSGTFARQRAGAVARAIELLDAMADARLHRWESGADHVTLIALDALPDVIWKGTLRQLKAIDHDRWGARFDARTDYQQCTDVAAAFRLAATALAGDAGLVHRYVFAFTDLIHEPPSATIRACAPAQSSPASSFPWNELNGVSTSVFWAPPNQVLTWRRAIDERDLGDSFAVYSVSESAEIPLAAPPRPTIELSAADLAQDRARYAALFKRGIKWIAIVVAVALLAFALLVSIARQRHRAPRTARGNTI